MWRVAWLGWAAVMACLLARGHSSLAGARDQQQNIFTVTGEAGPGGRVERAAPDPQQQNASPDLVISSHFNLNNSHLHLMVHWAGRGSSIVFCLARDQEINQNSTSQVFISDNYGTDFADISSRFKLESGEQATINKFFHHATDNCYYVFTDIFHKHIFVSLDCGETIKSYQVNFTATHVEFDTKSLGRFLVHDRDSPEKTLYVTTDYGETFGRGLEFIESFYWDYRVDETVLYISRMEPSGKLTLLSSSSFFLDLSDTRVEFSGALEFEKRGEFLFTVTEERGGQPGARTLHVARPSQQFVQAEFQPAGLDLLDFHVADVSEDGQVMVIVNHAGNLSNLYISDGVDQYEVSSKIKIIQYNLLMWISNLMVEMSDVGCCGI